MVNELILIEGHFKVKPIEKYKGSTLYEIKVKYKSRFKKIKGKWKLISSNHGNHYFRRKMGERR